MTDAQPPDQLSNDEIPLEDIEKLLASEDPDFAKQLEEVLSVETDQNVEIEATVTDDGFSSEESLEERPETGLRKLRSKVSVKWYALRMRVKNRVYMVWKDALIFLKTRPKEFSLYALALSKAGIKKALIPWRAFLLASRPHKLASLLLLAMGVASIWILAANFKGIWIPRLNEPLLLSLETHADSVETFDPKDDGESFYSAFPQERHEFLFRKMKVNLRRTKQNPLPMGAFEIVVLVDSKDTAIEVRDREVELFDLVQRVFEQESFASLETELGKSRLKGRLKRELNTKLTQGWVKDVSFKTFILKP